MKQALAVLFTLYFGCAAAAQAPVPKDDPRLQPAAVTMVPATSTDPAAIYIDGYIHRPTVEAIKRLGSFENPGTVIVYFNSLGGDLVASVELGQLIRALGLSTRVGRKGTSGHPLPGRCESGCPFAFAGGKFRIMDSGALMGVHQFYRAAGHQPNDLSLAQVASALVANHLSNMGVSLNLIGLGASAASEEMRYLTPIEAYDLGLVNGGAIPAHWEVRDLAGALVLVGEQETIQGTGRIAISCAPGNTVELAGLFKGPVETEHLKAFKHAVVQLNDAKAGGPDSDVQIRNGFLAFTTHPNGQTLNAVSEATSLSMRFASDSPNQAITFRLDIGASAPLIRSFIGLCRGERPSLVDNL